MKRRIALFLLLCLWITFLPPAHAQSGYSWVQSIGRPGGGGFPFGFLVGVTVDSSGNIYVTDNTNNTVDVLDNQGNFLFTFGSSAPNGSGTPPGTFNNIQRIARDTAGNLYIGDGGNNRIQKFDSKGRFLLQFGTPGSRTGQLNQPFGVAVDNSGNIYVAEFGNNRVQKFNAKGVPLFKFGSTGSGNGQFNNLQSIILDSAGNIYVADGNNNRVQKFSSTGKFLLAFGTGGSGNGQFNYPTDVALDSTGNIYVADWHNNRIQKFTANGTYIASTSVNGGNAIHIDSAGNLYAVGNSIIDVINPATMLVKYSIGGIAMSPAYIAFDSSGDSYVTDYSNGNLLKYDPSGKVLQSFPIPVNAQGVAVDSQGNIYVSDRANNQILKYPPTGGTPKVIAGAGSGNGQVNFPGGLAFDSKGYLYVADNSNNRIEIFTPAGAFYKAYGTSGSGSGQFNQPYGLTVDNSGNIYVAEWGNNRVQKLSATGKSLLVFGTAGAANGQFNNPTDVAVDGSGNIYVSEFSGGRIQKFSATGTFISVFPTLVNNPVGIRLDNVGNLRVCASGDGQRRIDIFNTKGQLLGGYDAFGPNYATFNSPYGIRLDGSNNLYVTSLTWAEKVTSSGTWLGNFGTFTVAEGVALDGANNIYVVDNRANNVQKFNSSLTYLKTFGTGGAGTGQFSYPNWLALDSSGNFYITDSGNYRVQKFNSAFVPLTQFGSQGTGDGQFLNALGIASTSNGNLLVTDWDNNTSWVNLFSTTTGFPFLGSFGQYGTAYGQFILPRDVNLDSAGNIYVADTGNSRIQIFDPNANFLYSVGTIGGANGQFISPASVTTDAIGNLYIADNVTNRISIFAPIPLLSSVTPLTAFSGSAALSLTTTGSGFTPDAVLTFNGMPLTTTFVSSTSLTATLPATLLATAGNFPVAVLQAGGTSNALTFQVTGALVPTITSLNPASTTAGVASVALTVTGTNFVNGAVIYFGTAGLPTTLVSSTQLTATVPASLLTTPGTVSVTVAQSGAVSNAVNFTINSAGAPPAISTLSPASVDLGSPTQTLTLTGTGFTSDAVVSFNGVALTTTFGSATQLTATLPANLLTTAGSFPVTVSQASGISSPAGFSVNAPGPIVKDLSSLNAWVGSPGIALAVTGSNFTSDAVVSFNGTALTTTFVSATQVVATLPATLLATAGIYPVVLTEASGASAPVYFAVNALPPTVTGLSPTAVLRGSAASNLIVTGSGFTSDAVITFNGTALTTTFGSSTQLTATIPASLLTTPGFYPVIVKQVSGTSRKVLFIVL